MTKSDKFDESEMSFDEFADTMLELVKSFKEVMNSSDPDTKLLAIEMLGELKEKMGETFQHLMEEYDIYPKDLEFLLENDKSEMTQTVHAVAEEIEKINQEMIPKIDKTLENAGVKPIKPKLKRKKKMVKRLKSKD